MTLFRGYSRDTVVRAQCRWAVHFLLYQMKLTVLNCILGRFSTYVARSSENCSNTMKCQIQSPEILLQRVAVLVSHVWLM